MKEIIGILQQELDTIGIIREKSLAQQHALASRRGGADAGQISEQLMLEMTKLSTIETKKEDLLKEKQCKTVQELIMKQTPSVERHEAEQLLQDLQMVLKELEGITAVSKTLLVKDMEFVGFTINVLNQVTADVTYAPEGASATEPLRGRKMFDQSV